MYKKQEPELPFKKTRVLLELDVFHSKTSKGITSYSVVLQWKKLRIRVKHLLYQSLPSNIELLKILRVVRDTIEYEVFFIEVKKKMFLS